MDASVKCAYIFWGSFAPMDTKCQAGTTGHSGQEDDNARDYTAVLRVMSRINHR